MKKMTARLLSALCVAALLVGLLPLAAVAAEPEHTVWLVGDSTVCDYTGQDLNYYWPRNGYGMQLEKYLDGTYKVENLALSGTSSKSYVSHEEKDSSGALKPTCGKVYYAKLLSEIKAGDALIVGFGHNDEKAETARYTNPNGDWQTEGSFAKSLWDSYVKPAQDKGAEVILCTPIVRRTTGATWGNDKLHITKDATGFPGGDYPAAIRKLGADKGVAVVDLTELTKAKYDELGVTGTIALHAQQGKDVPDNTHLNVYGAEVVAQLLAKGIKGTSTALAAHVDDTKYTPDKTHVTIGPEYKEPEPGTLPTTDSVLGEAYNVYTVSGDVAVTFKPTAFGALGGTPSKANPDQWLFETDAKGNMHMKAGNNKGKVNATQDGLMMYWYAIPADKQFRISATATVNTLTEADQNSQAAFGLMARDDMRIDARDCYKDGEYPNYVAAGTLGNSSTNCFYRKDGALTTTSKLSTPLAEGASYALSIQSNSDGYACRFGTEPAQSQGFDFSLTGVDKDYVYVGMFTARSADVTFSDIYLEIDGKALTPDTTAPVEPSTPPVEPSAQPSQTPGEITDAVAGGGLETLFAELPGVKDADVTAVSYTGTMEGELTGDDLTYLVRDASLSGGKTGVRIDIPGLKAGKYDLTVTTAAKIFTAKDLEVRAHDRSGFAHQTVSDGSAATPYTEGVGAYNDDGTLKDNAIVLYVTNENKDKVTLSSKDEYREMTVTGIGNILNSNNSKVNLFLLRAIAKFDKRPLVVRFLGDVKAPQGVSEYKKGSSNGGMVYMLSGKNITLEGIGPDATINGWGFSFGTDNNDVKDGGLGKNFEVRNLSFKNVPEDCVEVTGKDDTSKEGIDVPVEHAWVHNCQFYVPHISNPAEDDKAEGDGACDFKWGQYMTMSYNQFYGYHKTSLVGGADSNEQYHVTWHHNHWIGCDQRGPLGRTADMHIYNNIYENQTGYCMSLRAKVYIFSENNAFPGSKDPVKDEGTQGVCKSFGDDFATSTGVNHAVRVATKGETVSSVNKFANFDTVADSYVAKGAYKLDTLDQAKVNIETWGGVMQTADKMTTVAMTAVEIPPEPADKTELTAAITAAETAAKDIYVVADDTKTSDVKQGTKFVTKSVKDALNAAIAKAQAVAADEKATEETVAAAVTEIKAATETFTKAIQTGTKRTTSGGGGGLISGGGNRPSGGSTGGGGSTKPSTPPTVVIDPNKPASENFGDVVKDSWYEGGVTYVTKKGLFQGVAQGVFAPDLDMTRAMLMTVLARLDGQNTDGGAKWYDKGVAWAMEQNISDGTMLDMSVTREQMVTMLYRYAKPGAVQGDLGTFVDASDIHDWAREAMAWAVSQGILTGKDGKRLDPQGTATRAEVATIIQRFVEKTEKK